MEKSKGRVVVNFIDMNSHGKLFSWNNPACIPARMDEVECDGEVFDVILRRLHKSIDIGMTEEVTVITCFVKKVQS